MKKKILLIIALLSILMIGCTSDKESTLVQDGKDALESHKYSDAMKILSNALEEDSTDDHARSMYMQAMKMISVDKYKAKTNYKKVIEELEAIENIKNGSSVIKSAASADLKESKKLYEKQQAEEIKRKEDAKITAQKDAYKANQKLIQDEEKAKQEEEKKKQEEELKNEENNVDDTGIEHNDTSKPIIENKPQGNIDQKPNLNQAAIAQ